MHQYLCLGFPLQWGLALPGWWLWREQGKLFPPCVWHAGYPCSLHLHIFFLPRPVETMDAVGLFMCAVHGTLKEGDLGGAHIPPAVPILHLAEESTQWLEEPAGTGGSQGAAGPSGSPTPSGTAPHALPGPGPHQHCCGTCHL